MMRVKVWKVRHTVLCVFCSCDQLRHILKQELFLQEFYGILISGAFLLFLELKRKKLGKIGYLCKQHINRESRYLHFIKEADALILSVERRVGKILNFLSGPRVLARFFNTSHFL